MDAPALRRHFAGVTAGVALMGAASVALVHIEYIMRITWALYVVAGLLWAAGLATAVAGYTTWARGAAYLMVQNTRDVTQQSAWAVLWGVVPLAAMGYLSVTTGFVLLLRVQESNFLDMSIAILMLLGFLTVVLVYVKDHHHGRVLATLKTYE